MAPTPTLTGFIQRVAGSVGGAAVAFLKNVATLQFNKDHFDTEYKPNARPAGSTAIPGIATEGVIEVSLRAGAAGTVPSGRTLTATAPLRIDGGPSADLSADRTFSINAATTGAAGSMSSTDKQKLDLVTSPAQELLFHAGLFTTSAMGPQTVGARTVDAAAFSPNATTVTLVVGVVVATVAGGPAHVDLYDEDGTTILVTIDQPAETYSELTADVTADIIGEPSRLLAVRARSDSGSVAVLFAALRFT